MSVDRHSAPAVLSGLINDPAGLSGLAWEPFRDGIEVFWIYRTPDGGPAAALLRYRPGARVPRHWHAGWETIIMVEGSQADDHASYGPGSIIANPPGTEHHMVSPEGCTALLIWEKQPVFIEG